MEFKEDVTKIVTACLAGMTGDSGASAAVEHKIEEITKDYDLPKMIGVIMDSLELIYENKKPKFTKQIAILNTFYLNNDKKQRLGAVSHVLSVDSRRRFMGLMMAVGLAVVVKAKKIKL
jgi:hypothetical protein